jgi:ribosomal protein S14
MKKLLRKDKINRNFAFIHELPRFILKNILKNGNVPVILKWKALLKLSKMPKGGSYVVLCNRCVFTGRRKRFNKCYNFSRLMFLKFARFGFLSGLKKSTW